MRVNWLNKLTFGDWAQPLITVQIALRWTVKCIRLKNGGDLEYHLSTPISNAVGGDVTVDLKSLSLKVLG